MTRAARRPAAWILAAALGAFAGLARTQPPGYRVVLVSFDGAGGLELRRRLEAGFFSSAGFARAAEVGEAATRLSIVTPSLTAVSHLAMVTGALPGVTGIVGNTFHPAGTPFRERLRGFDADPATETLWEAAARQGKRVVSLGFPGVSQRTPRKRTALGLHYNEGFPKATLWNGPDAATPLAPIASLPEGARTYSPARAFTLNGIRFAVLDTTDDGATNYDTLLALTDDGRERARAKAGEWFALSERRADGGESDVLFGQWSKVIALAPDLSAITLYLGERYRTFADPPDFRRAIEARAGFWPGPPDMSLVRRHDPDIDTFLEQARRFSRFFVDAFEAADARDDWDLLLAYDPLLDECGHDLLLTNPAHPAYSKDLARRAAAAMDDAWREADAAAGRYLAFRERGDVFLVSDHGMRPMTGSVFPAAILARAGVLGIAARAAGGSQIAADSPSDFLPGGGGTGFFVVNRKSLPGGVLSDADADALVAKAAAALRAARDEAGSPVFAVVATRAEAAAFGLAHPNAGDLVVIAAGSRYIRGGLPSGGAGAFLGPPETPGQHGFDSDPALDGIFFHVGPGVLPASLGVVREIDVASRVAGRLGIAPPRNAP